ncbi:MAG: glucan biosynthesis protein D [Thermodesulfobacteriota bacterium]
MNRRDFLQGCAGVLGCQAMAGVLPPLGTGLAEAAGEGTAFSFEKLKEEARRAAEKPYLPRPSDLPAPLAALNWDQYQAIKYRPDHSLWRDKNLAFQIRLFHLGLYFKQAVRINEVVDGLAKPIVYSADLFDYGPNRFDAPLPPDLGFAGFRIHFQNDFELDLAAFLGASYFRATSGQKQYGLSARGLALDTGLSRPEEFPMFTAFWLERPAPGQTWLAVYALLDSESLSGAYSFRIYPGWALVMQIEAALYPRKPIERLGIAPLTSMFQCGENDRRAADDFRPEIHDSDGLSVWTGSGEWIWRPLINSPSLRVNSFLDDNPRGFGLLQRDREFNNYQDDGAFYHRRPSLWVEPVGQWGRGAVTLVEIPTEDETFDNIVAFWKPDRPVLAGQELNYSYRLHWCVEPPARPPLARVVATRLGVGGVVGRKRPYYSRKFVIDFAGGDLPMLSGKAPVEAVITASRGTVENVSARPLWEINGRRAIFDLKPQGPDPIDLRLYLGQGGATLTETWMYQWLPPKQ